MRGPREPARTAPPQARRRALAATLRWRARWLLGRTAPALADGARLFPVLLHASFERPELRDDAPGVAGLRFRPSWTRLARAFGLPPPCRAWRGAPGVQAVLARPVGDRLELVVLAGGALRPSGYGAVEDRMESARRALAAGGASGASGPRLTARLLDAARLGRDRALCHELAAFGALLAGDLPPAAWSALEAAAEAPLDGDALWALGRAAPTPYARLGLAVLCGGPAPAPLAALGALVGREPARRLADPSWLVCRWAGLAGREAALLEEALPYAEPAVAARALPPGARAEGDAAALLAAGRRLAVACARAARRHPPLARSSREAWRDGFAAGFPRALLPALRARLDPGGAGPVPLRPEPLGAGAFAVRLPGGAVLARGASPAQARVRGLALAVAALGEARVAGALDRTWLPIAARLASPGPDRALLLVLEGAGAAAPGAPLDPLNRGPGRALAFGGAVTLRSAPGRRATARELPAAEAVRQALAAASAGAEVEVLAARGEARPAAARLAALCARLRDPALARPFAAEVGGEVLVPVGGRVLRHSLRRFLGRPRFVTPDPEAPDLSVAAGGRGAERWGAGAVVEARVSLVDGGRAVVLYADRAGRHLREEVSLLELEEHLRDARLVLLAADRAALAVQLAEGLEPVLRRLPPPPRAVEVAVSGAAPFGLALAVGSERFAGPHRWEEAAQAVTSSWPIHAGGRLAVKAVTATAGGVPLGGLAALHVRSLALRRLGARVERALRSYRDSPASRRGD